MKFERAAGVAAPARKDTPMLRVVSEESTRGELASTLDEICREGARRMLAAALEQEAGEYVAALPGELDERGRRLVSRNGHARPRTITTAAGAVEIRAPRGTTAASMRARDSASGFARRSCRRGAASPRR